MRVFESCYCLPWPVVGIYVTTSVHVIDFSLVCPLVGDLVSMVTDLKVEDKNEDTLSIADSGVGTSSVITAATEVSRCPIYDNLSVS